MVWIIAPYNKDAGVTPCPINDVLFPDDSAARSHHIDALAFNNSRIMDESVVSSTLNFVVLQMFYS